MGNKSQLTLFNLFDGIKEKDVGMSRAAEARQLDLEFARSVAKQIARKSHLKECHIDLVQQVLIENKISLGNAAGSIFKNSEWTFTGKFIRSKRVSNHATIRRIWRLNE